MPDTRKPSHHVRTSARSPGNRLTKQQRLETQEKFLKAFSMTANVRAACMTANIDRSTIRQWEEHDETFSFRYNEAKEDANDMIRAEIWTRAMKGKTIDVEGRLPLVIEPSDRLLEFMAKARMPEYRDKQPEVNIHTEINTMAEQAKNELLMGLSAAIDNEDKD
jgi:hypothetical protein